MLVFKHCGMFYLSFRLFVVILHVIVLNVTAKRIKEELNPIKSLIFGPGLNVNLVYPARYFFIQAVNDDGNNFTMSPGSVFSVDVEGTTERCRIWTQVLDRLDGSYIVRYKLYHVCHDLQISVTFKGKHVANSPYRFKGPVYHEECYCPYDRIDDWLSEMECPSTYQQIENDLLLFNQIDMRKVAKQAKQRFNQPGSYSLCHYAVIENEVYRECIGQHVGFKMFMDSLLLSLLRKTNLPDLEFMVNLGDWPLIKNSSEALPILSWCKADDTLDIVMPTYDMTESTLESMGRVMLDMMTVQSNVDPIWDEKRRKAIWRGRDSRLERLQLVALSRQHPQLIDAALTNFFFFREKEQEYGPTVKHMSFFDFFKYKYQINIDGTVAAYRLPYLLAGNSVVFKQDSPYFEHFYQELIPMVHYIPFKRDMSDLIQKLKWATEHDEEVKQIGLNGRKFAQENLMPKDIFCYNAVLLKKFSEKLLRTRTVKTEKMEHVPQPNENTHHCHCTRVIQDKDEL